MAKKEILPLKRFPKRHVNRDRNTKPNGLWYAIGTEWIDWVKSEMPDWEGQFIYKIVINKKKILHLKSEKDIINFNEEYKSEDILPLVGLLSLINWKKVARNYSGIEISPWKSDHNFDFFWHCGWNVSSGCVWKDDAILSIKKIS